MLPMSRNCLIVHTNGGADCRQAARGSYFGAHGELSKRPESLGLGSGAKALTDNSHEIDEGSLPCTPELMAEGDASAAAAAADDAALDTDTRQLISQSLQDLTGLPRPRGRQSKALPTMRRVVRGVVEKHRYVYNGLINKLSLDDKGDDVSFVSSVAQSLFADGVTNWGRVASLMAFGAVVSQHLTERRGGGCVELVAQEISSYLLSEQRDWLLKNNSWDGFVDFFRESDPETTVMKSLMAFAGFAGLGATLALLIR